MSVGVLESVKRPRGASLKRRELGGWGWGLPSKTSSELGSSADGLIRIVRGSKDLNQWERIIKRGADDQRKWKKKNKKVVQMYRRLAGRLGKRQAGKNPVKWSRNKKRANEAIAEFLFMVTYSKPPDACVHSAVRSSRHPHLTKTKQHCYVCGQ